MQIIEENTEEKQNNTREEWELIPGLTPQEQTEVWVREGLMSENDAQIYQERQGR